MLLSVLATASASLGQNVFVVLDDGAPKQVKEIRFHRPMIEKGGKPDGAAGDEFTFLSATLHRPGLVTLTDFRVKVPQIENGSGDRFGCTLNIYGHAKSDTTCKNCFMVLEMMAWKTTASPLPRCPLCRPAKRPNSI